MPTSTQVPTGTKQVTTGTEQVTTGTEQVTTRTEQVTTRTEQVSTSTEQVSTSTEVRAAMASFAVLVVRWAWRLTAGTTRTCMRYRVTGLAAEAGFFALLSLPPLILGLVASVGFVGNRMERNLLIGLKEQVAQIAGTFLTPDAVHDVILPTFDDVFTGGRFEIISLGFVLSLWSGSRALNVFVDTISIMYGFGGRRGIIRTRVLSFTLYIASLIVGVIVIPAVLIGPSLLGDLVRQWSVPLDPAAFGFLYWPTVTFIAVVGLATLYHLATPIRTPWRSDVPGAALALLIWVFSSFFLRWVISRSVDGTSIYGPLATPIIVLMWLYFLAIAVLIGAALNAAIDEAHPHPARAAARAHGAHAAPHPITPVHDLEEEEARRIFVELPPVGVDVGAAEDGTRPITAPVSPRRPPS